MAPLPTESPDQNFESQSLLLLPVPSEPWTRSSIRTACRPSLAKLFTELTNTDQSKSTIPRIDIAAVLPSTFHGLHSRRATLFPSLQKLLEELYTLVCSIAAAESIELDLPGGLDVRVFFLADVYAPISPTVPTPLHFNGPLIDTPTLVNSRRPYSTLFAVESEQGEACLKSFLALHTSSLPLIQRVPGGTSISTNSPQTQSTTQPPLQPPSHPPHHSIVVGGTFDHLHLGHKLLLTATALALDPSSSSQTQLTIGITGDALLLNKKYASHVETWETRQSRTASFLESILAFKFPSASPARTETHINAPGPNGKLVRVTLNSTLTINYVQISDPFGPTITDEAISAIVISKETRAGGKAVNDKRAEKGWAELEVFEVDVLDAEPGDGAEEEGRPAKETFESKISSTELRRRIAEKEGTK